MADIEGELDLTEGGPEIAVAAAGGGASAESHAD
jgi:hypothetical protein